jgi:uncharacterized spore protein YtfJ
VSPLRTPPKCQVLVHGGSDVANAAPSLRAITAIAASSCNGHQPQSKGFIMTTKDILDRASGVLGPDRVYGTPYISGGITVIPAVSVRGGGGGGGGTRLDDADQQSESGDGGGFGVMARPAGVLLIDGDKVRWKVPFDLNRAIAGGQLVGVAFFGFMWLIERSKARAGVKIARINRDG